MNKLKKFLLGIAVVLSFFAQSAQALIPTPVNQGGTGVNTITGIIQGNGTAPFSPITIGSGLTFSGGTLSSSGGSGISGTGTVTHLPFIDTVDGSNNILTLADSPITWDGTTLFTDLRTTPGGSFNFLGDAAGYFSASVTSGTDYGNFAVSASYFSTQVSGGAGISNLTVVPDGLVVTAPGISVDRVLTTIDNGFGSSILNSSDVTTTQLSTLGTTAQTGNSGKFLTTDGSGTLSWGAASGGGITGVGTVNYFTRVATVDGSNNILTVQNGSAYEDDNYYVVSKTDTLLNDNAGVNIGASLSGIAGGAFVSQTSVGGGVYRNQMYYGDSSSTSYIEQRPDGMDLRLYDVSLTDYSNIKLKQTDLTVKSPNIVSGTVAQLVDDGTGDVALRSIADGSTGQVLSTNGAGSYTWITPSSGGSPGGSNTQLQYNNSGSFGGISGATTNGTSVTYTAGNLLVADVKASGSGGAQILSNSGTVTALFGAGGGANSTFYGGSKFDYATASTVPYFDASKNLISSSVTPTELGYLSGVTSSIQTQLNTKGVGDMVLASVQTVTGAKTFNDTKLLLRNVANTFNGSFVNTNTADRVYTLPDATTTLIGNNVGITGGSTIIGGTAVGDKLAFKATSNSTNTTALNQFRFYPNGSTSTPIMSFGENAAGDIMTFYNIAVGSETVNNYTFRTGTVASGILYMNSAADTRLRVANTDYIIMQSSAGTVSIRKPITTSITAGTGAQNPTLTVTSPAHTALTASTEYIDNNFNNARTARFATGAKALQRSALFQAPTYSAVAASTFTDSATLAVTGAPIGGTNATLTNSHALLISAGALTNTTNGYGLTVNAPTGATNNYAAQFLGGTTIFGAPVRLKNYTVATLPAGVQGDTAYVTDALAPVWGTAVAGGGAVVIPVFYNGANWIVD